MGAKPGALFWIAVGLLAGAAAFAVGGWMAFLATAAAMGGGAVVLARVRRADPATSSRRWLVETLRYFRDLGFFRHYADLPDELLADRVEELRRRETSIDFDPSDPKAELELLRMDPDRVWWKAIDTRALAGRGGYADVLRDWGRISRGAFHPGDVREEWTTESGPVRVTLSLDGERLELKPEVEDARLDLGILPTINRWIDASGIRLEVFEPFDDTAFVVALFEVEKERLKRERAWSFLGF
jgi:hypothetical protein